MSHPDLLVIRDQQLRVLGIAAGDAFIDKLTQHVAQVFPAHAVFVRGPAGRRFLERCVAAAERNGLRDQNSIALYADLAVALGQGFEEDARYQWITAILQDGGLNGAAKMFLIYNELPQRCPDGPVPPPEEDAFENVAPAAQPLVRLWPAGDWG